MRVAFAIHISGHLESVGEAQQHDFRDITLPMELERFPACEVKGFCRCVPPPSHVKCYKSVVDLIICSFLAYKPLLSVEGNTHSILLFRNLQMANPWSKNFDIFVHS